MNPTIVLHYCKRMGLQELLTGIAEQEEEIEKFCYGRSYIPCFIVQEWDQDEEEAVTRWFVFLVEDEANFNDEFDNVNSIYSKAYDELQEKYPGAMVAPAQLPLLDTCSG